jgi:hypothetical protein
MALITHPFATVTAHSHADKIEDAVVETLRADADLLELMGGQIFRSPLPEIVPEVETLPALFVSSSTVGQTFVPGGESDVTIRVVIDLLYEEQRTRLAPEDRSANSVAEWIHQLLIANDALQVPTYDMVPLAERLDQFAVISRGVGARPGPNPDELVPVGWLLTLGVDYIYILTLDL